MVQDDGRGRIGGAGGEPHQPDPQGRDPGQRIARGVRVRGGRQELGRGVRERLGIHVIEHPRHQAVIPGEVGDPVALAKTPRQRLAHQPTGPEPGAEQREGNELGS